MSPSDSSNLRSPYFSTDFGISKQRGQIYLLNLISQQGKYLRVWWKKNLKNLSEHARLLGTSEYFPKLP
jgi:hypothetical protein